MWRHLRLRPSFASVWKLGFFSRHYSGNRVLQSSPSADPKVIGITGTTLQNFWLTNWSHEALVKQNVSKEAWKVWDQLFLARELKCVERYAADTVDYTSLTNFNKPIMHVNITAHLTCFP